MSIFHPHLSHPKLKVGDSCTGGVGAGLKPARTTRPYTMRGAFGACYAMSRNPRHEWLRIALDRCSNPFPGFMKRN